MTNWVGWRCWCNHYLDYTEFVRSLDQGLYGLRLYEFRRGTHGEDTPEDRLVPCTWTGERAGKG